MKSTDWDSFSPQNAVLQYFIPYHTTRLNNKHSFKNLGGSDSISKKRP